MIKIILLFCFAIMGCTGNNQRSATPKEFLNHVQVDDATYQKDKTSILDSLYMKMKRHQESFSNPEFDDSTELMIDTIMYDFSFRKIAVFVVAKLPTYRNPYSQSKLPYYYHANCYIGRRIDPTSSNFELKCLCKFSEINFNDKKTVVKALKEDFFFTLATVMDANNQPSFRYNINDKRFCDSPTGWHRMYK